ncbi:hypothetical protein KUTG_09941 [Kutzneria sp. 744]|nr:hypothetical protein KUTG_09941 [Kutzneria sp. 744]
MNALIADTARATSTLALWPAANDATTWQFHYVGERDRCPSSDSRLHVWHLQVTLWTEVDALVVAGDRDPGAECLRPLMFIRIPSPGGGRRAAPG